MTTAQAPAQSTVVHDTDDLDSGSGFPGYLLIPLAEFGKSLDSPDLDVWFDEFSQRNKDELGEFEITAQGELKIMPATGFPGEWHEAEMVIDLGMWRREFGGKSGGPSSRFIMADGARLGPDAWWMSEELWNALPAEARTPPFAAAVPDFLVEIVSPSNRGPELAGKVRRYLEGGARLIWVINARRRTATIYRPGADPEILQDPEILDGGDVLPGFTFNVRERIFDNVP